MNYQIRQCLILTLSLGELILCIIGSIWSWSPRYQTCVRKKEIIIFFLIPKFFFFNFQYLDNESTQNRVEILTISLWVMFGSPFFCFAVCTGILEDWYQTRKK